MARPVKVLEASDAVKAELRRRSNARTTIVRDKLRVDIILLRLESRKVAEVAAPWVPEVEAGASA